MANKKTNTTTIIVAVLVIAAAIFAFFKLKKKPTGTITNKAIAAGSDGVAEAIQDGIGNVFKGSGKYANVKDVLNNVIVPKNTGVVGPINPNNPGTWQPPLITTYYPTWDNNPMNPLVNIKMAGNINDAGPTKMPPLIASPLQGFWAGGTQVYGDKNYTVNN